MNKDKYNQMSDKQKKAIDNNCNTEAAGRVGEPRKFRTPVSRR
jgi:hypothetical protein